MSSIQVQKILDKALDNRQISPEEALVLFQEGSLLDLGEAANARRFQLHPEPIVTFVIDRNINYTNACTAACRFCAFAYQPGDSRTYTLSYEQIKAKIQELIDRGGTQILMQGGHNPELGIEYYEELCSRIKADFPQIAQHCFSVSEIEHISRTSSISIAEVIERLKAAGWDSLPGAGAELLVERVRKIINPLKITGQQWIDIMRQVHQHGIGSSATMMFAHVETFAERIEHMRMIRQLQDETGGFRSFIEWTFQPDNNPLGKDPRIHQKEGTGDSIDYLKTQAIARLFLNNIANFHNSWVTEGMGAGGQIALHFGANDFGGTMLEENVVSAAGTAHSKSTLDEILYQIRKAGFQPAQRNNRYQILRKFPKDSPRKEEMSLVS